MSPDYVVKTLPAIRLVGRRAIVDPDAIGQRVGPRFDEVTVALRHVEGALATPVATYAEVDDGMEVAVGYAWAGPAPEGTEDIDLAGATAVCGVHLGEMARIGESWQALHRWVTDNGYRFLCQANGGRPAAADVPPRQLSLVSS